MWGVTGANGKLGRAVIQELRRRVPANQIVAFTRRPHALAELAKDGVIVRSADFGQSRLDAVFAGVTQLLLISTDVVGQRLRGHIAAVSAAQAAGVERLVYTSVPEPVAENPALVAEEHRETEAAIRATSMEWTMLRNGMYADMQLPALSAAARSGEFWSNTGAGGSGYVTRADCAAVAAHVLASRVSLGAAIDVTGPESVDAARLAGIAEHLGGRPVRVVEADDAEFCSRLVGTGMPRPVAEVITSIGAGIREGFFARVTSAVQDATGRPPESVRDAALSLIGRP